jgi:hypothetical protein
MKTILSIFDHSGAWSAPYWEAGGYDVIELDLQNHLLPFDILEIETAGQALDLFECVDGILAAPPCTDFTVSGAQYWPAKDAGGITGRSVSLVYQVLKLVDLFMPDWWAIENPVGRINRLVPELAEYGPRYFDPCDYAGYLPTGPIAHLHLDHIRRKQGVGVTIEEAETVMCHEAYTKKTGLWGKFTMPEPKRIEPVRVCAQGSPLQRMGGKSTKTKNARSVTPRGFARAFYQANNWMQQVPVIGGVS